MNLNDYIVKDNIFDEKLDLLLNKLKNDSKNHPFYLDLVEKENILNSSISLKILKSEIEELDDFIKTKSKYLSKDEIKDLNLKIDIKKKEYFSSKEIVSYLKARKQFLSLFKRLEDEILIYFK